MVFAPATEGSGRGARCWSCSLHEPFVGGGAVFFDLLPKKADLSDLNRELITTYNVSKNEVDALIKSLKKHKYKKEYYLKIRAQDPKKLSEVEVASLFIYLNRTGLQKRPQKSESIDFVLTHPLYANIIKYSEGQIAEDLTNIHGIEEFANEMEKVARELYRVLKPGKFCAILIAFRYPVIIYLFAWR
ncbi:MAG: hypothetical protein COV02_00590 [Candidatus Terrybacteria bacterium CG10_big_fil_rev_8_21_14_0_10_41_10]|uniref:Uncharacterized protein n=1 Tax=Candidatus Terrybacteria bacterium CG10_big_fil_rev_8_21_14_0_10_41_10 TaxID=1975026 RepID=A0A2M8LAX8_9BACT|nr:MAG: hypothetical protein COV02_00590 [Candidatus Terrybacteria bacterium CG10_big_fil_rev_8_21_14_0_10_41_10]